MKKTYKLSEKAFPLNGKLPKKAEEKAEAEAPAEK